MKTYGLVDERRGGNYLLKAVEILRRREEAGETIEPGSYFDVTHGPACKSKCGVACDCDAKVVLVRPSHN